MNVIAITKVLYNYYYDIGRQFFWSTLQIQRYECINNVRTQGIPGLTGVRLTGLRMNNNNVFYITGLFTDKDKYL